MEKTKISLFVFVLVSLLDITGILFEIPLLVLIFKPLVLLSLMLLYFVTATKINKIYVLALVCSFFGDVLLMYVGDVYFTFGLVSFLLAHLIFIKIIVDRFQKPDLSKIIMSIIPFAILFIGIIYFLKDDLNELFIPVVIYGFTISTFGVVAMLDYMNTRTDQSFLMFVGAVIFISSDSILAINKFYNTTQVLEVFVMATYIVAQFLIYKSMVAEGKLEKFKV